MMQQRVHQRAAVARVIGRAGAGMHHHAGRLVHDSDVVVFINNVERDCLWNGTQRDAARLRR